MRVSPKAGEPRVARTVTTPPLRRKIFPPLFAYVIPYTEPSLPTTRPPAGWVPAEPLEEKVWRVVRTPSGVTRKIVPIASAPIPPSSVSP